MKTKCQLQPTLLCPVSDEVMRRRGDVQFIEHGQTNPVQKHDQRCLTSQAPSRGKTCAPVRVKRRFLLKQFVCRFCRIDDDDGSSSKIEVDDIGAYKLVAKSTMQITNAEAKQYPRDSRLQRAYASHSNSFGTSKMFPTSGSPLGPGGSELLLCRSTTPTARAETTNIAKTVGSNIESERGGTGEN